MQVVHIRELLLEMIEDVIAGADYDEAKIHLYQNDYTPNDQSTLEDFTECDYTGYASQTITWSTAYYDENNVPLVSSGEKLFICTGSTSNVCYGMFVTDAAGTKLLFAARMDDAPFAFSANHVGCAVTTKISTNGGSFDRSDVP